ncbi:MAG: PD-(D/E)XK nuclease family protein [Candidatus Pacearchaeota archaeon]
MYKHEYIKTLNYSALKSFIQCPRRYFTEYLYKEFPKAYSPNLVAGMGVHAGFEEIMKRKRDNVSVSDSVIEKIILKEIDNQIENIREDGFLFEEQAIRKIKEEAVNIVLQNKRHINDIFGSFSEIEGIEYQFYAPIPGIPEHILFHCRIDLITRLGDVYSIWDYKTVNTFWGSEKKRHLEGYTAQLLLYKYFYSIHKQIDPSVIRTFFLLFRKRDCAVEKWQSFYTHADLKRFLSYFSIMYEMLKNFSFPPVQEISIQNCKFCPAYNEEKNLCSMVDVDTKKYILEHYNVEEFQQQGEKHE